jgi:hypothetical protein
LQPLERGILAADALAGGEPDAPTCLLDRCEQRRQERRIVLSVAIQRGDDLATRGANARADGGGLAAGFGVTKLAS